MDTKDTKNFSSPRVPWCPSCPLWLTTFAIVAALLVTPGAAQQPTFRSGTKLVVQTVNVKDKDGKPVEGLTARDFVVIEDGEPQAVSFVEYQRLDNTPAVSPRVATTSAPDAVSRPASTPAPPVTEARISVSAPGDIKYRNRRLVVVYFDMTALPPADLSRAYSAAQKFVKEQMQAADLLAIMSFEGGAVRVKQDFTDDRDQLRDVIARMIFGNDLDGDGIPDTTTDIGTAFGQDDAEFNILNTDRQLSALQTAMSMLGGLPDQKSLVYFASGLRLNGTDNQAQLRATTNAALRASVAIFPGRRARSRRVGAAGRRDPAIARRDRRCSPASWPRASRPTSSARRTRCIRSRRTPAARRCSTTTISRWASSRRSRR